MRPLGLMLIAVLLLLPVIWLPGIAQGRDVLALFSQYLGMVALIGMAISQVIATRWRIVEPIFGPLDQSYRIHKWLGIGALAAMFLHDVIDAEMQGLGAETLLVDAAETAGEISLYAILILVIITVATFIPYTLWKWTHRFIGIFFVLSAFHYLFILKPFSNFDPLGLYMTAVCLLGTMAYIYTSMPRGMRPSRGYKITGVEADGSATSVIMRPTNGPLQYRPGQFAFFRFDGAGISEPHPFTISSAPETDGQLRTTIAPLGDLTRRIAGRLQAGQAAQVDGPYGHFGQGVTGPQVWIGAGVGVTPFAAMAGALEATAGPITMILAARTKADAIHLAELRSVAERIEGFTLVVWSSADRGRLTADKVIDLAGKSGSDATYLFCGPVEMRRSLAKGLSTHGVTARRFRYEEFEIRTGIGLKRLLRWRLSRDR